MRPIEGGAPPPPREPLEVAVLGGGAAGLLAAIRAASLGARTAVFEKNRKPGAKILASGGGRCNVTTAREGMRLEQSFPPDQARFLRFALRAFPPARIRALLEAHGVRTREEAFEKVFPEDGRASSVLAALLGAAAEAGLEIVGGAPSVAVRPSGAGLFEVAIGGSAPRTVLARTVILAVGGRSYPKSGTTGDGYAIAAALGHRIIDPRPALVALALDAAWAKDLAGVAVADAAVRLEGAHARGPSARRPLLFTHEGVSGPAPMDVARAVPDLERPVLVVDLLPDQPFEALERALVDAARLEPRRLAWNVLPPALPERLRRALPGPAGIEAGTTAGRLPRDARRRLVHAVKELRLPVAGTAGWERAEVTRGGVALDEVDPRSMESRKVPGFFVAGEVLDVDGPIGGFNFQAAFATGWAAGEAAAREAARRVKACGSARA